jgi:CRP-like cAMP-binding protein
MSSNSAPHKAIPAAAFKSRSIEKLACQVPEAVRTELAHLGKAYRVQVGEIIFRKGQPSRGVFLIVSGRVVLLTDDAPIQITRIGQPGSLVGVPATINNRPYSLTAEAVEKTDLMHIGIAEFKHLLKSNSTLCYSIVSMLSQEISVPSPARDDCTERSLRRRRKHCRGECELQRVGSSAQLMDLSWRSSLEAAGGVLCVAPRTTP